RKCWLRCARTTTGCWRVACSRKTSSTRGSSSRRCTSSTKCGCGRIRGNSCSTTICEIGEVRAEHEEPPAGGSSTLCGLAREQLVGFADVYRHPPTLELEARSTDHLSRSVGFLRLSAVKQHLAVPQVDSRSVPAIREFSRDPICLHEMAFGLFPETSRG